MTLFAPGDAAGRKLAPNTDFLPLLFTDSGKIDAGLVFAGWGISAPELGYDDYAGLDVKGKIVLCFRGTPAIDDPAPVTVTTSTGPGCRPPRTRAPSASSTSTPSRSPIPTATG